jgi:hypothetical protein
VDEATAARSRHGRGHAKVGPEPLTSSRSVFDLSKAGRKKSTKWQLRKSVSA